MDILANVMLLGWFVLSSIMIYAAFFSERKLWGIGDRVGTCFLFVLSLLLIINNYVGNEVIQGTVAAVSKVSGDEAVTVELSESIKTEIQPSKEILKAYEVAIFPNGSKQLKILGNKNSLWRFKFNKREIQLQIEAGKTYSFRVHRLFFGRNIVDIQEE